MIAHIRGGQGEERLAAFIRRDGRYMSRSKVRMSVFSSTAVLVGAPIRAAVAAVCARPNMTGVGVMWTVCAGLVYITVFFWIAIVIIMITRSAGRTALLTSRFGAQSLGL